MKGLSDQLLDDRSFKETITTPMPCMLVKRRGRISRNSDISHYVIV